jgi:nucleotide-binding universal stress UspA family protein
VVLLVDQPLRKAGEARRPGDELVTHLSHHGVKAKLSRVARDELRTSDAILAEVTRMKSELLVMGAHAEGGIMSWFRSDVARDVVAAASIPVLMAH